MLLRFDRGFCAFEHLLDQVDASTRAIQFVAQDLIRGARRRTKTAVHARTQNGIRLNAFGRVFNEIGEIGLHG